MDERNDDDERLRMQKELKFEELFKLGKACGRTVAEIRGEFAYYNRVANNGGSSMQGEIRILDTLIDHYKPDVPAGPAEP